MRFKDGITLKPESIKLLAVMSAEEAGEAVKALCLYASGVDVEEAAFVSEKASFAFMVLKSQVDGVEKAERRRKT